MELYARVRRAVLVDGMSRWAVAREFGLARKTVSEMLEYSVPPAHQTITPLRKHAVASKRHILPLVRAPCGSSACGDLCGGRAVRLVPTATKHAAY